MAVNLGNPRSPFGWRRWLMLVGALALVITSVLWMRSRNTRTVTFRFGDAGSRDPITKLVDPVTNVVVTLVHWRRTWYPDWLVRVFPKLPPQAADEERRIVCVSDTLVFPGIPISFDGTYALEFKNENYQSIKRMFINSNPKGRYSINIEGCWRVPWQMDRKDPRIERLRDLRRRRTL